MVVAVVIALTLLVIGALVLGCVWSYKDGHEAGRDYEAGRQHEVILGLRRDLYAARQASARRWVEFAPARPPIPPQAAPEPSRETMTWPAVRLSEDPTTGELRAIGDANVAAISDGVMA
jgi:hypothetical protein